MVKAHESLLGATELRSFMLKMRGELAITEDRKSVPPGVLPSFIELGRLWQAPLYEMTLYFLQEKLTRDGGLLHISKSLIAGVGNYGRMICCGKC